MITATRPLQLVALDSSLNQKRLGIDGRICDAKQYATTQRWSAYLYGREDADGIHYRTARRASSTAGTGSGMSR